MQKILFSLSLLLLTSLSVFSQRLKWEQTAEILFDILDETIEDVELGLQSVGGGSVDLYGVEGENALEYVVAVNKPSLINSLTQAELKKRRDGVTEELIQNLISNYGEEQINTIISSMAAASGEINIIFTYEGGSSPLFKEIAITADDMTRIYQSMGSKLEASPAGHTYVATVNGMKITLNFKDERVNALYNDGRRESSFTYSWYKEGKYVIMSDEDSDPFEISSNGQTLTDITTGVVFKRIK